MIWIWLAAVWDWLVGLGAFRICAILYAVWLTAALKEIYKQIQEIKRRLPR